MERGRFLYFSEQFEARIFVLKLYKVLDGRSTFEVYVPSTRPNASRAEKDAAIDKGREIFKEKQMQITFELVSALDKQSVLYLRPYKGNGAQAWDVLTKRFRSFERPRFQKLVSEITSLVKRDDEILIEYITRAEELQFNLNQVNEGLSGKMFTSILMKGLPIEFDNFVRLVNYGSEDKSLDELKQDLINFDTERRIESDRKNASESVFLTKQKRCHNCNKFGHIAKFCLSNNNRKPHNPQPNTSKVIQCYNCNKFGHIATDCRNKMFESHARRSVRNEKQNLAKDEEYLSFFLFPVDDEGVGLVLDSGEQVT